MKNILDLKITQNCLKSIKEEPMLAVGVFLIVGLVLFLGAVVRDYRFAPQKTIHLSNVLVKDIDETTTTTSIPIQAGFPKNPVPPPVYVSDSSTTFSVETDQGDFDAGDGVVQELKTGSRYNLDVVETEGWIFQTDTISSAQPTP